MTLDRRPNASLTRIGTSTTTTEGATMTATDPRQPGESWFSSYWAQTYTVLSREERGGDTWFTVRWADGRVTTHATPLGRGDRKES